MAERDEVRVGAFVLAGLAILGVGSLWVAGSFPLSGERVRHTVLMKGSAGVRAGDFVRVSGVEVGRVRQVVLRPGNEWPVLFQVELDPGLALNTESSAMITSDGLLGTNYLEIVPGLQEAPPLPPNEPIYGQSGGSIAEILRQVGGLAGDGSVLVSQISELLSRFSTLVEPLLGRLERLLSDDNLAATAGTLTKLSSTTEKLGPELIALVEQLRRVTEHAEEAAPDLPQLTATLLRIADDLEATVGPGGVRLGALLEQAERTLSSADGTFSLFSDNRGELEATIHDLRETAAHLRSLSQTLEEEPSSLVWRRRARDREPRRAPEGGG